MTVKDRLHQRGAESKHQKEERTRQCEGGTTTDCCKAIGSRYINVSREHGTFPPLPGAEDLWGRTPASTAPSAVSFAPCAGAGRAPPIYVSGFLELRCHRPEWKMSSGKFCSPACSTWDFQGWGLGGLRNRAAALTGWLSWLGHCPINQKVSGLIPHQGTCLGCGFDSWSGHIWEATN